MNITNNVLVACATLLLCGCLTNDFKVVDALRCGMTKEEAQATITGFSFQRSQVLYRPETGWASEKTFTNLPGRAQIAEEETKVRIATAEYYPVGHGMFGFGQLFLFYDEGGRLVSFYRRQIN